MIARNNDYNYDDFVLQELIASLYNFEDVKCYISLKVVLNTSLSSTKER